MCGIAGIWNRQVADQGEIDLAGNKMLESIVHRGPDDGGYSLDDRVFLGNRRLKIFDLSEAGNQPMFSRDGRYWIVFNGEIYNYCELKPALEKDFTFSSHTDTEVLLYSFVKHGIACVEDFIGMFAFAIWDSRDKELIICRDRLGIKPLYYYSDGTKLIFASEIKALLAAGVKVEADHDVIKDYLVTGNYDHTDRTFFRNIRMLKAGHFLKINERGISEICYWNNIERIKHHKDRDQQEVTREYWEMLDDAVKLRMRADVSYAVMLSGGLDSSALAVIADKYVGSSPLNVCTFRHRNSKYDEGPWANLVAEQKNWRRHEVFVTEDDVVRLLNETLWHQDEPFGGVASFADVMLSKKAREDGLYVLLEGQGADETLGGYEYYYNHRLADLAASNQVAAKALFHHYAEKRNISDGKYTEIVDSGAGKSGTLTQDGTVGVRADVLSADLRNRPGTGYISPEYFGSRFENALFQDLFNAKVPRVLRFKDKSSMMFGVELRVPFLDHRIVERSFSIATADKLKDGYTKYCLRKKMESMLPSETCWHVKRQVQTPQREWMRTTLKPVIDNVINSVSFSQRGLFDISGVRNLYARYISEPDTFQNSFFVWQWLMIENWFRIFVDGKHDQTSPIWCMTRNHKRMPTAYQQ